MKVRRGSASSQGTNRSEDGSNKHGSDRVAAFIRRKLICEPAFALIGKSDKKSYQDDTLPIGINGSR